MRSLIRSSWFQRTRLTQVTMRSKSYIAEGITKKPNLDILLNAYQGQINKKELFCLNKLEEEWSKTQPLKDKVILVNVHMTLITLTMIRILLKGGAIVETTASPELVRHENAIQALKEAGICFHDEGLPEDKRRGFYNAIYDCGAQMLRKKVTPKDGVIELTHTDPKLYDNLSYPVITVDSSKTKEIETGFGTGDSLVRLINYLSRQSIAATVMHFAGELNTLGKTFLEKNSHSNMMHLNMYLAMVSSVNIFQHNQFMIFGYGKVGKGIANALESAGTPKKNIFVVEVSTEAFMSIMENGYNGILNNHLESAKSLKEIKDHIPKMWAVITATGVEGAVSRHFKEFDFNGVPLLINMGTSDEFGHYFSKKRIVNDKKPANFKLDFPTSVMYLDAIFRLFLEAIEQLFTDTQLHKGLNPVSSKLDRNVLSMWMREHGKNVWQHALGKQETESLLRDLREHSASPCEKLHELFHKFGVFDPPRGITPLICLNTNQNNKSLAMLRA